MFLPDITLIISVTNNDINVSAMIRMKEWIINLGNLIVEVSVKFNMFSPHKVVFLSL